MCTRLWNVSTFSADGATLSALCSWRHADVTGVLHDHWPRRAEWNSRCTPRPRVKGQKRGETGCVGGLSNSTQYKLAYRCFHFFTCAFLFHEISRNFCFTHDSLSLPLRNAYRWITSSSGFPANRFNLKRYQETARWKRTGASHLRLLVFCVTWWKSWTSKP